MKRLLAAGAFALSAALLARRRRPSPRRPARPRRGARLPRNLAVRSSRRRRSGTRQAAAAGASPASVTTTTTDADCSAPATIAGPLSAGTAVTGQAGSTTWAIPTSRARARTCSWSGRTPRARPPRSPRIQVYYSTQPYSFTASADGDRLVACIGGGDGADGDEQATITANVPPAWQPWTSLPGVALNSYPDCHPDAAGIGCWARSAAAQLVENDGPPDGPRSWTTIGGSIAGPPTCLVRSARTDCFDSTSLNRLTWTVFNGSTWGSFIDLGANASGQPFCLARRRERDRLLLGRHRQGRPALDLQRRVVEGAGQDRRRQHREPGDLRHPQRHRLLLPRRQRQRLDVPRLDDRQGRPPKKIGTGFGLAAGLHQQRLREAGLLRPEQGAQLCSRASSTARAGRRGATSAATSPATRPAPRPRRARTPTSTASGRTARATWSSASARAASGRPSRTSAARSSRSRPAS